jgi:serine/threonine-protein kinase
VALAQTGNAGPAASAAAGSSSPPRDPVAGEALFREGRRLLKAGDVQNACKKLEESDRLDPAPGTLANLAECYEQLGRTASAWEAWRRFADQVPASDARRATALSRSSDLEKRLPRLSIELGPGAPPELQIARDQVPLGPASLKLALPVDPGPHVVVVTSPGRAPRSYDVTLGPGELRRLAVGVGPSLPAPVALTGAAPAPVALTGAAPAPVVHPRRTLGVLVLATAAATLGAGSYFGVRALQARNEARGHCSSAAMPQQPPLCWNRAYDALSNDPTYSRLADAAFATSAVLAAVGTYLVLKKSEPGTEVAVGLGATPKGGEVQLAGRF